MRIFIVAFLLSFCCIRAEAAVYGSNAYNTNQFDFNGDLVTSKFLDPHLRNIWTGIAQGQKNRASAVMTVIGDSYEAIGAWTTNVEPAAKAVFGDGGFGFSYANDDPTGEGPFGGPSTYIRKPIVKVGGPWCTTNTTHSGPLFSSILATNAATLIYTNVYFKTAIIYYLTGTNPLSGGTFTIGTNGYFNGPPGGFAQYTPSGTVATTAAGQQVASNIVTVPLGIYDLSITAAAPVSIIGVDFRGGNGFVLNNMGMSGTAVRDWVAARPFGDPNAFSNMLLWQNPNVVLFDLGRNELLNFNTASNVFPDLTTLVTIAQNTLPYADIVVCSSPDMISTNVLSAVLLEAPIRAVAWSNHVGYIDLWHNTPPYQLGLLLGTFADQFHPTDAGGLAIASVISQSIFKSDVDPMQKFGVPRWEYYVNFSSHQKGLWTYNLIAPNPPQVQDMAIVAAGANNNSFVVKVPNSVPQKCKIWTRWTFSGDTGQTNFFFSPRVAAIDNTVSTYNIEDDQSVTVGGITNGLFKFVDMTNQFFGQAYSELPRHMYLQINATSAVGTGPTGVVNICQIRFKEVP